MDFISVTSSLSPFSDPDEDVSRLLAIMTERCKAEQSRAILAPTDKECHVYNLYRFLKREQFNEEAAMARWTEWVQWRHGSLAV